MSILAVDYHDEMRVKHRIEYECAGINEIRKRLEQIVREYEETQKPGYKGKKIWWVKLYNALGEVMSIGGGCLPLLGYSIDVEDKKPIGYKVGQTTIVTAGELNCP